MSVDLARNPLVYRHVELSKSCGAEADEITPGICTLYCKVFGLFFYSFKVIFD